MTPATIKAKYINGSLQLLERVNLPEGQEVALHIESSSEGLSNMDAESRAWLDANLSGELPPYEWGEDGIPEGKPIRYDPEKGFMVVDE